VYNALDDVAGHGSGNVSEALPSILERQRALHQIRRLLVVAPLRPEAPQHTDRLRRQPRA